MTFEVFSFFTTIGRAAELVQAGCGLVIDLEAYGKEARQADADTQINAHTFDDLRVARAMTDNPVICRIDGPQSPGFIDQAVRAANLGADEILVPMVVGRGQLEEVRTAVGARAQVSTMIETGAAVDQIEDLASFGPRRAYFGLHDYAIDIGQPNLFAPVADGTVEKVAAACRAAAVPFGFAGLTHPSLGSPIPARALINEMARLHCSFSFTRRSFERDVGPGAAALAIAEIRAALREAERRPADQVARDAARSAVACQSLAHVAPS